VCAQSTTCSQLRPYSQMNVQVSAGRLVGKQGTIWRSLIRLPHSEHLTRGTAGWGDSRDIKTRNIAQAHRRNVRCGLSCKRSTPTSSDDFASGSPASNLVIATSDSLSVPVISSWDQLISRIYDEPSTCALNDLTPPHLLPRRALLASANI
jgi:hypothetical protein